VFRWFALAEPKDKFPVSSGELLIAVNAHEGQLSFNHPRGRTTEDSPMKSRLLITTAAVMAGMTIAAAQETPRGGAGQQPGASTSAPNAGGAERQKSPGQAQQQSPGSAQQSQDKGKIQQSQDKGKVQQSQDKGQAPQNQDRGTTQQTQDKAKTQQSQEKTKAQGDRGRDQTTGQGVQGQGEQRRGQRREQGQETQGQVQRQDQTQQPQQGQRDQQGQPPRAQHGETQSGSGVTLTTEQRQRIRETVIASGNAPRVSQVNFSIRVGTEIPRSVRAAPLPPVLVELRPEWRGYLYFVVNDQIVVVDPNSYRIVAVLAV
jgi:hypothetical protein